MSCSRPKNRSGFRGTLCAVALALTPLPGLSQDAPLAIGRITYGDDPKPDDALCSAVLVAPDLILTAGHCVRALMTDPQTIRFAAGWNLGQAAAIRRGTQVILQNPVPVTAPADAEEWAVTLGQDVALVVLDIPIPSDVAAPLKVQVPVGDKFTLITYRRDMPDLQHRQDDCSLIATAQTLLGLTCPVVSGNSGAPVLEWNGTAWRVVAVMLASSAGSIRSWAARPSTDVSSRISLHLRQEN